MCLCQDASPAARRGSPGRRGVPGSGFLNILLLPGGALACFLRRDLPVVDLAGLAGRGPTTGRRRGAGAAAPQSVRLSPDAQQVARRKGSD